MHREWIPRCTVVESKIGVLLKERRKFIMLQWIEEGTGRYELCAIENDERTQILMIYDERLYCPQVWENRMGKTSKSFDISYRSYNGDSYSHSPLISEDLESAKNEAINVLLDTYKNDIAISKRIIDKCNNRIELLNSIMR